jgi:hypothetical protein
MFSWGWGGMFFLSRIIDVELIQICLCEFVFILLFAGGLYKMWSLFWRKFSAKATTKESYYGPAYRNGYRNLWIDSIRSGGASQ